MQRRFQDKVVLVVGGSSGIGLACAKAFRAEAARVVLTARDPDILANSVTALGAEVLGLVSDVTNTKSHESLAQELRARYGRVDVLFASAGTGVRKPICHVTEEDWDTLMSTNLKGHYFLIRALLPLMMPGASIVLTSSLAATRPRTGNSVYAASKAAVSALTRSLCGELVARGIRINAVSPGPIDTPRRGLRPVSPAALAVFGDGVAAGNPMKRWGTAEEVAHAVLFLASGEASFITGVTLPVDGGAGCL
jgi:NAD(P)-dependent dehydrogenase (short-subunit alcohol dehydrogenase family)